MSTAERLRTICALQQTPGFSPSSIALALNTARERGWSLDDLGQASDADLAGLFGWKVSQVGVFRGHLGAPIARYERLAGRGIRVSTRLDPGRSGWCDRLPSTPWFFYLGDITLLEIPAVGFSGSRDASEEALEITRIVATEAAKRGMAVVSGGARGVDMAAHSATLEAGGCTVVLVPQGLDTWSVPGPLADPEVRGRVLVMSEDLPWSGWATPSAMQRNRTIVDLAKVVVIPQAGTTGGSASTGLYAISRKRAVWVADLGETAPGNQLLLQRGAHPLPWNGELPDLELMRASRPDVPAQGSLF